MVNGVEITLYVILLRARHCQDWAVTTCLQRQANDVYAKGWEERFLKCIRASFQTTTENVAILVG